MKNQTIFEVPNGMALSVFNSKYSRIKADGNYQSWEERIEEVVDGNFSILHEVAEYKATTSSMVPPDAPWVQDYETTMRLAKQGVMPFSGRHLQHGDLDQANKSGNVFTNCFDGNTTIATLEYGVVAFKKIVGKTVTVKAKDGKWRPALVSGFGKQKVYKYTFIGKQASTVNKHFTLEVNATENHKWFLEDGSETTDLKVGDALDVVPTLINEDDEAVLHGIVFGDGSGHRRRKSTERVDMQGRQYCSIRLCGEDKTKYGPLFTKAGYTVTTPDWANGDRCVYIGRKNWKDLPYTTDPNYIAGFIKGWWYADGSKSRHETRNFMEICTTRLDAVEWLKANVAMAGYMICGMSINERKKGDGSYANGKALYILRITKDSARKVYSKKYLGKKEVYCVTEPVTGGFVLGNGILTGNCSTAAWRFLCLHMLLEGSGVGTDYSSNVCRVNFDNAPHCRFVLSNTHPDYQYRIESLEDARHKYDTESENVRWFEVEDSREGWARAVAIIETAAWQEKHKDKMFIFDMSKIRCAGTPIKGQQGRPASGPVLLIDGLNRAMSVKGAGLKPWKQALYIDHYLSEVVQGGGIRRSARASIKNWRDRDVIEFIDIKRGGFLWSSNNSVAVDAEFWELARSPKPSHARRVFEAVCSAAYYDKTGEPGFLNVDMINNNRTGLEEITGYNLLSTTGKMGRLHNRTYDMMDNVLGFIKNHPYQFIANPCVTADTLIMTDKGQVPVYELIGVPFKAKVNGRLYNSKGFFKTGYKPVYKLTTESGHSVTTTDNHEFYVIENFKPKMVAQKDLTDTHALIIQDHEFGTYNNLTIVKSIEKLKLDQDVYDCTVDEIHMFDANGITVSNCFEVPLAIYAGVCVVGDINMAAAQTREETIAAAGMMAKFLIRVNRMEANYKSEIDRTNRIGVSIIGLHEFAWKQFGYDFYDLLDEEKSLDFWLHLNEMRLAVLSEGDAYSISLGMVPPHSNIVVKPGGTTGKVMAVTEGIHLPPVAYYTRWVQSTKNGPEHLDHEARGYPIKDISHKYAGYVAIGFPSKHPITDLMGDRAVTADMTTIEQQFKFIQLIEKYWLGPKERGGMASVTCKYDPTKVDYDDFMQMILDNQPKVRCAAVMPIIPSEEIEAIYGYQPEEAVSRERYNELVATIDRYKQELYDADLLLCEGGACPIDFNINEVKSAA